MTEEQYIEKEAQKVKRAKDRVKKMGDQFRESVEILRYPDGRVFEYVFKFENGEHLEYSLCGPASHPRFKELDQ